MLTRDQKKLEKYLFAVLGRRPYEIGLVLEEGGWISVKELSQALMADPEAPHVTSKRLFQFLSVYRPPRFQLDEDRVRVVPEHQPSDLFFRQITEPPEILYVAFRPRTHAHVLKKGLAPWANKKWIILADTKKMALQVGKRWTPDPILATIFAKKAYENGQIFQKAGPGLYVTERVEVEYMEVPPIIEKDRPARKKELKPETRGPQTTSQAPISAGSFFLDDMVVDFFENPKRSTRKKQKKDKSFLKKKKKFKKK